MWYGMMIFNTPITGGFILTIEVAVVGAAPGYYHSVAGHTLQKLTLMDKGERI
jgi:hypothetical protein